MPGHSATVFPFPARRRVAGARLGQSESVRRGQSADVASSRPYQPGDDMRMIDWGASAKLTAVKGQDSFVVREFFAEETPYAALVVDRSPSLNASVPAPLLDKQAAVRTIVELVADSAVAARTRCSYLDGGEEGGFWLSPYARTGKSAMLQQLEQPAPATPSTPAQLLVELSRHAGEAPPGTLVFLISDFLGGTIGEGWQLAQQLGWEIVPVIVQDARFERSFPLETAGLTLVLHDGPAYISANAAKRLQQQHVERSRQLQQEFVEQGAAAIWISSSVTTDILAAFIDWSRAFAPRRR